MKICTKCKIKKDPTAFYKRKLVKDGLNSWCKDCHRAYNSTPYGREV